MTDLDAVEITSEFVHTPRRFLPGSSNVPTYAGIAVTAVGFALIAVAWAKVAGLADVSLQLPYLVSAGITGLALVMVGLLIINMAAKRQDNEELSRQLERLTGVLTDLQRAIDERR